MPNTYTQIHIHFVFAVKFRQRQVHPDWKERLYQYITAILQNEGHKMLIINGVSDHVHFLVGMRPNQSISELMQKVKASSSKWVNEEKLTKGKFAWQEGFGAFSYSRSQLPNVIRYIQNQEKHHQIQTFAEEYREILEKFEVKYDTQYLFKPLG